MDKGGAFVHCAGVIKRPDESGYVTEARAEVLRWAEWIDSLEDGPLDPFEYEALLLHRMCLTEDIEIAGVQDLFAVVDAIDARFDALTVAVDHSPFAADGPGGTIPHRNRVGRWWRHVPRDPISRSYALGRYAGAIDSPDVHTQL